MFLEEHEDAHIHVFDSKSAAAGEHLLFEKIAELADKGLSFEEVIEQGEAFRDDMRTIFVLDDLRTEGKDSRLFGELHESDLLGRVVYIFRRRGI